MDIYIKSFNRPYYLERCLRSVDEFVKGDYNIVVLDDGTPDVYLNRIRVLFPHIRILKSDLYEKKSNAVKDHVAGTSVYSAFVIPTSFWYTSISQGSSVFLLLEEDAWLTSVVDLGEVQTTISKEKLSIVKIGWNGCEAIVTGIKHSLSQQIDEIIPSLPVTTSLFLSAFLQNKLKIRSILRKLKVLSPTFILPYYALYTVSSAFFEKSYWLYLWQDAGEQINEGHQLLRAATWLKSRRGRFAKTHTEKLQTSFITASVNRFKTVHFDLIRLHHYLNDAWLRGDLDAMQSFPRDFRVDYLKGFISLHDRGCTPEQWDQWIYEFKQLYRAIGCTVDN